MNARRAVVPLVALGLLCPALPSRADAPVTWTGPDGGSWSDPTGWSTGSVPGAGDTVVVADHRVRIDGAVRVAELTLSGATAGLDKGTNGALAVSGALTWSGGELSVPTTVGTPDSSGSVVAPGTVTKRLGTTSARGCSDASLLVNGAMRVQGPLELTAPNEPLRVTGQLVLDGAQVGLARSAASRCGDDASTGDAPQLEAPDLVIASGTASTVTGALELDLRDVRLGDGTSSAPATLTTSAAMLMAPALTLTGTGTLNVGRPTTEERYGGTLAVLGGALEVGAGTVLRMTAAYGLGDGSGPTVVRAPADGRATGGTAVFDRSQWEGALTFAAGPTSEPEHEVDVRLVPNGATRASFGARTGELVIGSDLSVPGGAVLSSYPERVVLAGRTTLGPLGSDGTRPLLDVEPGGLAISRTGVVSLASNAVLEGGLVLVGTLDLRGRQLEIASRAGGPRPVTLRGTLRTAVASSGAGAITGRYASISLGGALVVSRSSSYAPASGKRWSLVTAGTGTSGGSFARVSGSPGTGLRYVVRGVSTGVGANLQVARS